MVQISCSSLFSDFLRLLQRRESPLNHTNAVFNPLEGVSFERFDAGKKCLVDDWAANGGMCHRVGEESPWSTSDTGFDIAEFIPVRCKNSFHKRSSFWIDDKYGLSSFSCTFFCSFPSVYMERWLLWAGNVFQHQFHDLNFIAPDWTCLTFCVRPIRKSGWSVTKWKNRFQGYGSRNY